MFDFEKFPVYLLAENIYGTISKQVAPKIADKRKKDQLRRASLSIVLNIAEGAGKYSSADKKNYYLIARGSVHECVALIRILRMEKILEESLYHKLHHDFEEVSMMLSGLIKTLFRKSYNKNGGVSYLILTLHSYPSFFFLWP